jgi:putative oxidoreductase
MKQTIRNCFIGGTETTSVSVDIGLTILRISTGFMMAAGHGWYKIPPSEQFIEGVGNLGFPYPMIFAWMAAISEFFGGILLALGLFTRPAAFFIAGTMFVAAFVRHWEDPFFGSPPTKEMALLYLTIAIAFMIAGSGRFSVDQQLR